MCITTNCVNQRTPVSLKWSLNAVRDNSLFTAQQRYAVFLRSVFLRPDLRRSTRLCRDCDRRDSCADRPDGTDVCCSSARWLSWNLRWAGCCLFHSWVTGANGPSSRCNHRLGTDRCARPKSFVIAICAVVLLPRGSVVCLLPHRSNDSWRRDRYLTRPKSHRLLVIATLIRRLEMIRFRPQH